MHKPDPLIKNQLKEMLKPERLERINEVVSHRTQNLTIVLDRVYHEHNISAVLRSADAFGIQTVHLIGERFSSQRGISLGTEKWVDVLEYKNPEDLVTSLKTNGYKLVSLVPPFAKNQVGLKENTSPPVPVINLPFEKKLALIFGSESEGISESLFNSCDIAAYIPMFGFVESLNISVACALTLFSSFIVGGIIKQRPAPLQGDIKENLEWEWIKKSIPNSEIIISELEKRAAS